MSATPINRLNLQIGRSLLETNVATYDPINDYNSLLVRDGAVCFMCDVAFSAQPDEDIYTGPGSTGLKANKRNGWTCFVKGWQSSHASYATDPTTKMLHLCANCMLVNMGSFDVPHLHDDTSLNTVPVTNHFRSFVPCMLKAHIPDPSLLITPADSYFYRFTDELSNSLFLLELLS